VYLSISGSSKQEKYILFTIFTISGQLCRSLSGFSSNVSVLGLGPLVDNYYLKTYHETMAREKENLPIGVIYVWVHDRSDS